MKMDRADFLVGLALVGAAFIVAAVVVWTAGAARRDSYPLYAQFSDITGVAEKGGVFLRGYEIGRIREIRPVVTEAGALEFRVRMDVRWSLAGGEPRALPVGTSAVLRPPLIIGAAYIELRLPEPPGPARLEPGAVIPGFTDAPLAQQTARLSGDVVSEVSQTLLRSRVMMDSLVHATAAAHQLLEVSLRSLPGVTRGVEMQLVAAGELMATAADLMTDLRRDVGLLSPRVLAGVDSTTAMLSQSRTLLQAVSGTFDEAQPAMHAILSNLERTSLTLDYFARTVAERPTRMLTGVRLPSVDSLRVLSGTVRH
jgi:ABC-type transporter Mla subunit MlaD